MVDLTVKGKKYLKKLTAEQLRNFHEVINRRARSIVSSAGVSATLIETLDRNPREPNIKELNVPLPLLSVT